MMNKVDALMRNVNKVGRPSEERDNRAKLVAAARVMFVALDYDKVSLRAIANKAEVDSALIRYYFQSKLGLFHTMVKETAAPIVEQLIKAEKLVAENSCESLMAIYYRIMAENPDFPKLMFKIASMSHHHPHLDFQSVFQQTLPLQNIQLFNSMHGKGFFKEGVDPLCAQISFFSLMVFPFLIPELIKQIMGIKITPEFMAKLGEQNASLLQKGLLANG
jgi:AcrR family transcriptional regulator